MPLPTEKSAGRNRATAQIFALSLLVAASLQIMENLVPRIPLFPWMRIGLSYVIILPFLLKYGPIAAFTLLLARNLTAVLYGGQPFSTFLIGSGAGAITLLGMGSLVELLTKRRWLGLMGASIILASTFNLAQLALVKWLLIRHAGFYFMIGPMLAWSILSGGLVAFLVHYSETDFKHLFEMTEKNPATPVVDIFSEKRQEPALFNLLLENLPFLFGLLTLAGILISNYLWMQIPTAIVLLWLSPDRGKLLLAAWPFFFYVAYLHLFHTPGEFLFRDWITYEGLTQFLVNFLRLANSILLGRWLSKRFPWKLAERSESPYLQGFLISLPLLTNIFGSSMEFGREMIRRLKAGQRKGILSHAFEAWQKKMEIAVEGIKAP
jgi:uncharacterized membrane protein